MKAMNYLLSLVLITFLFGVPTSSFAQKSCKVDKKWAKTIKAKNKRAIKILAIGNSFSEDAIENYLFEIGQAEGVDLIIGNMFIGGCSLEQHWNNIKDDRSAYEYRKVGLDGKLVNTNGVSVKSALHDEDWDFVTIQQASPSSGLYDTYVDFLPPILAYFKQELNMKKANLAFHQTWAYAKDSGHGGFANYHKNQYEMYAKIVNASTQASYENGLYNIIPAGTAIQNARTSYMGDTFCKDGFHLDVKKGRFTAACTWFAHLFQVDARDLKYTPDFLTPYESKVLKTAVYEAVRQPQRITILTDFLEEQKLLSFSYSNFPSFVWTTIAS